MRIPNDRYTFTDRDGDFLVVQDGNPEVDAGGLIFIQSGPDGVFLTPEAALDLAAELTTMAAEVSKVEAAAA